MALADSSQFGRVLIAALAQIPAVWVVTSLVMVAFGWWPRATLAVWGLLVAFIVVGEFGALWELPEWILDLSPLRHAPILPVTLSGLAPIAWLLLSAGVLSAAGYVGWHRRDLTT